MGCYNTFFIMKNTKIFITIIFVLIAALATNAQIKSSFFEIEKTQRIYFDKQFNNFKSKSKEDQKRINKAYKKYIRWHWYSKNRIDINNSKKPYTADLTVSQRSSIIDDNSVNWNILGPTQYPSGYDQSGLIGIGRINATVADPNNTNHIFIGTVSGGIWETYNLNGDDTVWNCLSNNIPIGTVSDLKIVNNTLFVTSSSSNSKNDSVGSYGLGVIKKGLNDSTWYISNEQFNANKIAFSPSDSNIIYAIGPRRIYKSTDFGDSWVQLTLPFSQIDASHFYLTHIKVHPNDSNKVIISGANNRWIGTNYTNYNTLIFKTTNGGNSWQNLTNSVETFVNEAINNSSSTEHLLNLQVLQVSGMGKPNSISLDSFNDKLYIGISSGYGFRNYFLTLDSNWNIYNLYNSDGGTIGYPADSMIPVFKVIGTDRIIIGARRLYLIKNDIHQRTYIDGNYTYLHQDIRSINYDSTSGRLLIGTDGDINMSFNDSDNDYNFPSFTNISGNLNIFQAYNMSYVNINGTRTVRIGNQDTGFYRNDNDGNGWSGWSRSGPFGEGEIFADYQDPNIVYFFKGRRVYKSIVGGSNNGDSYTGAYIGNYGHSPFEIDPIDSHNILFDNYIAWDRYPLSLSRNKLDSIHNIANGNSDLIYGVNSAAKISKSNTSVCYLARNRVGSAAGINNKIFKSVNLNDSYSSILFTDISNNLRSYDATILDNAFITDIEVDDVNENNVWITFGNFEDGKKIYHSSDGGDTWENITGNLPNVPVNVIKYDAVNNKLFIGNDYGVYWYDTESNLWTKYGNNLPVCMITSISIDHITNEIIAGTYGKSVWSANLEDCGDYIVIGNEVWNEDHEICGDLIIKEKVQLVINKSILSVNNIILKDGASFIINDSSITSNYLDDTYFNTEMFVNSKAVLTINNSMIYHFNININQQGVLIIKGKNTFNHSIINILNEGYFNQKNNSNIILADEESKINLFEHYQFVSELNSISKIDEIIFAGIGSVNILNSNTFYIHNERLNNGKYNFDADHHIETSGYFEITNSAKVNIKAGNSIILNPETYIASEKFKAFIDNPDITLYEKSDNESNTSIKDEKIKEYVNSMDNIEIHIYPNPVNEILNIQYEKEFSWSIYTENGRKHVDGINSIILNVNKWPKGVYLFKAILENGDIIMKKIVKN